MRPEPAPLPLRGLPVGATVNGRGRLWHPAAPVFVSDELGPGDGGVPVDAASRRWWSQAPPPADGGDDATGTVSGTGVWTGKELVLTGVTAAPPRAAADSWSSPIPLYSGAGREPAGGWRPWTTRQHREAWQQLTERDLARLISLKSLRSRSGTVYIAVVEDTDEDEQWARALLTPLYGDALVVERCPWSGQYFNDADQHIGARLRRYEVLLHGVRLRADGLFEIYLHVASRTDELNSWLNLQPPGMIHTVPWLQPA